MNYKIKFAKLLLAGLLVFTLAGGMLTGCSHSSQTRVTETNAAASPATSTTTTVHETHVEDREYGLFGGVFHVVGEVLAFPFDLVANLFRFIF